MSKGGPLRQRLTHFLCIPLVTQQSRAQLNGSLQVFRQETANSILAKALRPVDTLHLTLGVMALNQRELQSAIDLLTRLNTVEMLMAIEPTVSDESTSTSLAASQKLVIDLCGLESMHDPADTSILYVAPKDTSNRLQAFCMALQNAFKREQLLVPEDRPLKLHATIVNTVYVKGALAPGRKTLTEGSTGHGPKAKSKVRLDATAILEQYSSFTWAEEIVLDRIAICEMGAKKQFDEEGRLVSESYKEVAHVALPK